MMVKVYSQPKDLTVKNGIIEEAYRTLGEGTNVVVYRNTKGNLNPWTKIETTFGEAVKDGLLSTDNGTMVYRLELDDSEKSNFFGGGCVEWVSRFKTFCVKEPKAWDYF